MAWLTELLALIQLAPSLIGLIQQIISVVSNHPAGPVAGVAAVSMHLDKINETKA